MIDEEHTPERIKAIAESLSNAKLPPGVLEAITAVELELAREDTPTLGNVLRAAMRDRDSK